MTRLALTALLLVGCGDTDPIEPDATTQVALRGACAIDDKVGGFAVEAYPQYSSVEGRVADGVTPSAIFDVVLTQGECQVLRRRNPFCDPPCTNGWACGADETCIPFPEQLDIGTVVVTGLDREIELEPRPPGNNYFETNLAHPVFEPDAVIGVTADSAEVGQLSLNGEGSEPLVLDTELWQIEPGESLQLGWNAAPAGSRTHVALNINIDLHGISPMSLSCELDDDGEAEVPAELIDELLDSGVSGFPTGSMSRRTADSAEGDLGCIELVVASRLSQTISVSGHTPCITNAQCPEGQTCDVPIQTCI
jgi:hypothetical protein